MQTQVCLYNTQTHKISTTQSASIQYMEPTPGAQPTLEVLHHSMQEVNRELLQDRELIWCMHRTCLFGVAVIGRAPAFLLGQYNLQAS